MGAAVTPTDEWWEDLTDELFLNDTFSDYPDYEDVFDLSWGVNFKPVFIAVMLSVVFVVGILANALLLKVLLKSRKTWRVTDTFILQLAVANVMLLATLPLWAAQYASVGGWVFGTLMCKTTVGVFMINFYCGIFLMLCISVVYCLSIVRSAERFMQRNPWVVHACCVGVWIFSLLLSIPDWISLEVAIDDRKNRRECLRQFSKFGNGTEEMMILLKWLHPIVGFLLPSVVLILCFSCILLQLWCSSPSPQKQQAFKTITALSLLFFLCQAPFYITLMWEKCNQNTMVEKASECINFLDKALTITSTLGYFHWVLNPILFVLVDVKLWLQLRDMWGKTSNHAVFQPSVYSS
ncbi:PREDICTED: C-X-C chemokine receptor type 3-like [Cyprinodon variegatus]|uniref:C-X-C chemokine receptor type 3-like n=1 Tax=Cyprinodon variegatus TaxID=28743 RepID=UPI000742707E|nr:PREDICTED: C-X-C chemokine receptor type 3-like [Cyprinodon variegatus]